MNTATQLPAPSPSLNPRDHPCFGTDPTVAALNVVTDGGVSYLLPYAQLLYAERTSNPALEGEPDAPPERLLIRFAMARAVVLGSGLNPLERALQRCELKFVRAADRRFAAALKTQVTSVDITFDQEAS